MLKEKKEIKGKWGGGGKKACAFFLGCKRSGESPGLGLLSSERCRAHCPRRGLSQVNKPKATEKVRQGRRKRENGEQKGRGWSQLNGRRRVGRGRRIGPRTGKGPGVPVASAPPVAAPRLASSAMQALPFNQPPTCGRLPRTQDSQPLRRRDLETQAQTPGVFLLPGSHPTNTFPASSFFLDETASSSPPTKPPAPLPDAPPPRKKSFSNLSVSLLESQNWNRHTLSGEVWPHGTKRDQPQLSPAPPQPAGSESYRGLSRLPELIVKFSGTLQGCF